MWIKILRNWHLITPTFLLDPSGLTIWKILLIVVSAGFSFTTLTFEKGQWFRLNICMMQSRNVRHESSAKTCQCLGQHTLVTGLWWTMECVFVCDKSAQKSVPSFHIWSVWTCTWTCVPQKWCAPSPWILTPFPPQIRSSKQWCCPSAAQPVTTTNAQHPRSNSHRLAHALTKLTDKKVSEQSCKPNSGTQVLSAVTLKSRGKKFAQVCGNPPKHKSTFTHTDKICFPGEPIK